MKKTPSYFDVWMTSDAVLFPVSRSDMPAPFLTPNLLCWLGRRKSRSITRTRSEEHTSELQSLMRISYAVFCLKKKKIQNLKLHKEYTKPRITYRYLIQSSTTNS